MSDSVTNTTLTLDPVAPVQDAPDTETENTTDAPTVVAPDRLDSPIERLDLGTSDTFIPEAVDQLLVEALLGV